VAVRAGLGLALFLVLIRLARRAGTGARVRGLTPPVHWRLPGAARAELGRRLADADVALEPEAACELWLALGVAVVSIAAALSPGLLVVVVPSVLGGGPAALLIARGRAERRFTLALPGALEQVAAGLRGGAGLVEILGGLAQEGGPLADDLRRVLARAALGQSLVDALASWTDDRPSPAVRAAAGALALAVAVGGRAADALDGLGSSLRERAGVVAEARALSAQARLSAVVAGAAPTTTRGGSPRPRGASVSLWASRSKCSRSCGSATSWRTIGR
jgi:tight adherence protein B